MDFVSGASATVLGMLAMLSVPAYVVLQIWLAIALKGRWRLWALLPLLFAAPMFAWSMLALTMNSNLWPLPFILFAPLGTIYLVATLVLSKAFATRPNGGSARP